MMSFLKEHKDEIQSIVAILGFLIAVVIGYYSIMGYYKTSKLIETQLAEFKPKGEICAEFNMVEVQTTCRKGHIENSLWQYTEFDKLSKKLLNEREVPIFFTTQMYNKGKTPLELHDVGIGGNCTNGARWIWSDITQENMIVEPFVSKTYNITYFIMFDENEVIKLPCKVQANIKTNFGNFTAKRTFVK
ncbi:MAG: hypothetical protein ACE5HY_00330 [Candidatus Hydrothermarchaeales archaeon]